MNFSLSAQLISVLQEQPSVTLISLQGNFNLPAGFNECIRREELGEIKNRARIGSLQSPSFCNFVSFVFDKRAYLHTLEQRPKTSLRFYFFL